MTSSTFGNTTNTLPSSRPSTAGRVYDNTSGLATSTISEVMKKFKQKSNDEKLHQTWQQVEELGSYNPFSRPKVSKVIPLRSVFLDPEVNNFAPSKTRTELMKKIHGTVMPHPSYDIVSISQVYSMNILI